MPYCYVLKLHSNKHTFYNENQTKIHKNHIIRCHLFYFDFQYRSYYFFAFGPYLFICFQVLWLMFSFWLLFWIIFVIAMDIFNCDFYANFWRGSKNPKNGYVVITIWNKYSLRYGTHDTLRTDRALNRLLIFRSGYFLRV